MKRVEILAVGRLKERALRELCDDYYRRCNSMMQLQERELRDLQAVQKALPERGAVIALDERGTQLDSRGLAEQLQRWLGTAPRLAFVIGGADGIDQSLRDRADYTLSLSKLTFSHRLARVLLAEQLYRAVSILQGSPYHRD